MSTTTIDPGAFTDDRPLHERVQDALNERKVGQKAFTAVATVGTAATYAGVGYIAMLLSLGLFELLTMPAWFLTASYYGGIAAIVAFGITGAMRGYTWGRSAL